MTEGKPVTSGNYLELRLDPIFLLSLISKHVKVQLIKKQTFSGFIHSIDPMTYSIVLLVPQKHTGSFQTTVIPGHGILDVTEVISEIDLRPSVKHITPSIKKDIAVRKQKLISWFKWNLLPVNGSGKNIILWNVSILPPYEVSDVCTDNPIVAMQVSKIMQSMPENFNSDVNNKQKDNDICKITDLF